MGSYRLDCILRKQHAGRSESDFVNDYGGWGGGCQSLIYATGFCIRMYFIKHKFHFDLQHKINVVVVTDCH